MRPEPGGDAGQDGAEHEERGELEELDRGVAELGGDRARGDRA